MDSVSEPPRNTSCTPISFITGTVNQERLLKDTWSQVHYVGLFALQTFSQLSIAFLIGFMVRKAFIALGLFLFYFVVFEPIIVGLLKVYGNDLGRFMPLEISDRLIPIPAFLAKLDKEGYDKALAAIPQHVLYTIALTTFIWLVCFRVNKKRDLK